MSDKNMNQSQIEKLIEKTNELEKRELALNQEAQHLERLRATLDERERMLADARAEAAATPPEQAAQPAPVKADSVFGEHPLAAGRPAPPPAAKPAPPPAGPKPSAAAEAVTEINDILKSIFWDYSSSVHQISSQLSTVTAAMMCAAVTCVLENRGFDTRDVFLEEMEKMLRGGGLGEACAVPSKAGQPAPVPAPAVTPQPPVADEGEQETVSRAAPAVEPAAPQKTGEGVLRIAGAAEFQKLGEYGFRNDEKLTGVEIPEGVEHLPGSFFYGCRSLREVWLPDSLCEIGPYAFYGCESLHTVHLSEDSALRAIGEYAFAMCSSLQTFAVPETVETLGTSVFRFCSSLQKLRFVKNGRLRSIGSHLLQNCSSLEKLRLPDGITVIPTSMCYGCALLKKVVAKGVDTIEDYAFYGNESLRVIRVRAKKAIAPQAFEGCDPALEIEYLDD